jgi:hypothetical protein
MPSFSMFTDNDKERVKEGEKKGEAVRITSEL